jgi:hypothetical protein
MTKPNMLVKPANEGKGDAINSSLNAHFALGMSLIEFSKLVVLITQSKSLTCNYSFVASLDLREEYQQPSFARQSGHAQQSHLPNVFFIDHDIFQQGQMAVPTPSILVPEYVSNLLGGNHELRKVTVDFFTTIHTFMPIVSKKTFYDLLLNPLLQRRADVAFLCLCMKLVLWIPSDTDSIHHTGDYAAVKQYLSELEAAGVYTLQVLQGRLLITLFEHGHCVYPAAYMSISASVAHGFALGLDNQEVTPAMKVLPWVEMEERRRVWWAVIILERFLSSSEIRSVVLIVIVSYT